MTKTLLVSTEGNDTVSDSETSVKKIRKTKAVQKTAEDDTISKKKNKKKKAIKVQKLSTEELVSDEEVDTVSKKKNKKKKKATKVLWVSTEDDDTVSDSETSVEKIKK